jgi:hypothetical protein
LPELAQDDRHCEVVADAVAVAQPDDGKQRSATTEHVNVVAEAVEHRTEAPPQRLGAGHAPIVPTALDRAQIQEVELHHLEAPGAHLRAEVA